MDYRPRSSNLNLLLNEANSGCSFKRRRTTCAAFLFLSPVKIMVMSINAGRLSDVVRS